MAKIILTVAMAGARSWSAGDEYECSDGEAARMVAAGRAIPVAAPKKETATKHHHKETRGA